MAMHPRHFDLACDCIAMRINANQTFDGWPRKTVQTQYCWGIE